MEEMTEFASQPTSAAPARPACDPPEDLNCDGDVTMEEMTEYASRPAADAPAP